MEKSTECISVIYLCLFIGQNLVKVVQKEVLERPEKKMFIYKHQLIDHACRLP